MTEVQQISSDEILTNTILTKEQQSALSPQNVLDLLKEGNKEFTEDNLTVRNNTQRVRDAASDQYPKAAILSCLDSRVPVEDVFHRGIDDLSVARVAGNIVNEDILGSLEYACKVSSKKKEFRLIRVYMYICDLYDKELKYYCQRYSNNSNPTFTDQEIMTIYLFAGHCQKYFQIKDIHSFASDYLSSWFPKLPSYQIFNYRLNLLTEAFKILSQRLISSYIPEDCDFDISFVGSFPIITCAGRNKVAKVAREIANKGFCSTKNQYYYGLKPHALAYRRSKRIPFPESLFFTGAEENDLTAFKQIWDDNISNRTIFGDKIYSDFEYFNEQKTQKQNIEMLTPVKAVKGQSDQQKHREKAYNDSFSTKVSKVRQPIESFFNWVEERTKIQKVHKVRSTSGLLVHVMGKIAIAFIYLIF